jgi:hypothetical protein
MSDLIIANGIAPIVLTKEGGIFIFISIIPVEMLIIWLFLKPPISRLFIGVLGANIATSILGIPVLFMGGYYNLFTSILPFSFLISFLLESAIYKGFFKQSCWKVLVASFASNLVSYIMCASFLVPFSENSELFYEETNPSNFASSSIRQWLIQEQIFYSENGQFASPSEFKDFSKRGKYYKFEMQSEPQKATIVAIPKRNNLRSLRGTIFGKDKGKDELAEFTKIICLTEKPSMTPPEMPQLVKGELQCPPGSRKRE